MAPSSQEWEPPGNPGRFSPAPPCRHECDVPLVRAQRQTAPRPRATHAVRPVSARTAIGAGKLDLDHLNPAIVPGRRPACAAGALRTGRLLALPVHVEVSGREALALACLPALVGSGRAGEV